MNHSTKLMLAALLFCSVAFGQGDATIPPMAKAYIAPMQGFETYLAAAMAKKKVPVTLVSSKEQADFEITGTAKEQRNGVWRAVLLNQYGSQEDAWIQVTNIKTGVVAFAYAVNKPSSRMQSSAEACAKHLKHKIEKSQ